MYQKIRECGCASQRPHDFSVKNDKKCFQGRDAGKRLKNACRWTCPGCARNRDRAGS
jgi:hypothetical protein